MRGQIKNRDRKQQIVDYSGLQYGKISPTDIDGAIDFHGKCYVFIELKLTDTQLPYGQYKCFEALTADIKKPVLFIVASHNVMNPNKDIIADKAKVRRCFCNREFDWFRFIGHNVKEAVDAFKEEYDG